MTLSVYQGLTEYLTTTTAGLTAPNQLGGLSQNPPSGAVPGSLVAVANNSNFPTSFNTSASWVHNAWTTHRSGPVNYTGIEVTFLNGLLSTNSEPNAGYDFVLRCGILLNGTFYQGLCNGSAEATVSRLWGTATFTFAGLTIPANTTFYVTNRRVASDGGAAGSYDVITNTGGITQRQDGVIAGTDNTKDFTLGVGVAFGARNNRVTNLQVNASGQVTGVTRSSAGQGYSGGLTIAGWYGPAGAGAKGATIPGSGITGYGNSSGGLYTTTSITGGGTLHSSANPPFVFVGGSGTAANGFGTGTATYGPTLIAGVPSAATPSVLGHGDSIMAGYGSVDTLGDLNANSGCYEQTLANQYGFFKLAVSGESAAGWRGNNTKQLAFIDAMIARGLKITHVILGLGVNDFLTNTNTDVVSVTQTNIAAISAIWKGRGVSKVLMTTIPPYNTAVGNNFTTVLNQTIGNINYTLGGRVDSYNTAIIGGTPANDGVIDIRTQCQDSVVTTAWRTDTYGGSTAFCGTDGIHPSMQVGIPYLLLNMTIPPITVP